MTLSIEPNRTATRSLCIPCDGVMLVGDLSVPKAAHGIVMFIPGSGSSRHCPRNWELAQQLQEARLGTLLLDLFTHEEEARDLQTGRFRFDIDFLTRRVLGIRSWLAQDTRIRHLPVGYFGAGTGSAAALAAAASRHNVRAIVSRDGQLDLASDDLCLVKAPTLLIVGGADEPMRTLNEQAYAQLYCERSLQTIPGAAHLFEEPDSMEQVTHLARHWFLKHLTAP